MCLWDKFTIPCLLPGRPADSKLASQGSLTMETVVVWGRWGPGLATF